MYISAAVLFTHSDKTIQQDCGEDKSMKLAGAMYTDIYNLKYITQALMLDVYLVTRVKTRLEHLVLNCAHFNLVSI